jgi:hypothetical protein
MITAMTVLLLFLAIAVAMLLVDSVIHLVDYIRDDGYRRSRRRTPPQSHHPDPFDPRSRFA